VADAALSSVVVACVDVDVDPDPLLSVAPPGPLDELVDASTTVVKAEVVWCWPLQPWRVQQIARHSPAENERLKGDRCSTSQGNLSSGSPSVIVSITHQTQERRTAHPASGSADAPARSRRSKGDLQRAHADDIAHHPAQVPPIKI